MERKEEISMIFSVSELSTTESWTQQNFAKTYDLSFDKVNDTVDRIQAKDVSLEEFIERYEKPYKPVSTIIFFQFLSFHYETPCIRCCKCF